MLWRTCYPRTTLQPAQPCPPSRRVTTRFSSRSPRQQLYGDSSELLADDLLADLFDPRHRSDHFLNYYSEEGAKLAFERYGFYQLLRDKGFDPQLAGDLSDPDEHKLRIYDGSESRDNLLIELAVGFRDLDLPDGACCHLLFINWLLMQNPRQSFPPDRSPLPDQAHPGLGLFPHFGYLLRLMALRLECDGLMNNPAHFYNGVLYGRFFHFIDPKVEGRFRAFERDLEGLSLAEATVALADGRVKDAQGTAVHWEPASQVAPITNKARAWFASEAYRAEVAQVLETSRFQVEVS